MLKSLSLESFGNAVASEEAVPGGGSVSALAAGLAASLTAMVATMTLKKEKFHDVAPLMTEIREKASSLQNELMDAVDQDADSYRQVLAAFRLPKSTEEEKAVRKDAIQAAFKHAAIVPLQVAQAAVKVIKLAGQVAHRGNPDMITDAGVGVLMARSAALGALMNVAINLGSLKDRALVEELRQKVEETRNEVIHKESEILMKISFDGLLKV